MAEALTYADWESVRDVLTREVTRVRANAASVEQRVVEEQIRAAEAEIDAKLTERYIVPFVPVPPLIHSLTVDIAAYRAHLTYRENRALESELDPLYLRYQHAQDQLTQLQTGRMIIPPLAPDPADPPSAGSVVTSTITRPPLISVSDFDLGGRSVYRDAWTPEYWGQW